MGAIFIKIEPKAYDLMAEHYDVFMQHSSYYQNLRSVENKLFEKYTELANSKKALDIGCGTGEYALRLASKNYATYAVDISTSMLRIARRKARERKLDVIFMKKEFPTDFYDFDLKFDVIVAFGSFLNHQENWENFFSTVQRLLNPGGKILFSVDNILGLDSLFWLFNTILFGRNRKEVFIDFIKSVKCALKNEQHFNEWRFFSDIGNFVIHLYYYPLRKIKKLASLNYIPIKDIRGANFFSCFSLPVLRSCAYLSHSRQNLPFKSFLKLLDSITDRLMPPIASNFVVYGQKIV